MTNQSLRGIAALFLVAMAAACSKKDGATTTTTGASATAAGTTAATAAATTGAKTSSCVDGAYKDPAGIYCVKLPTGCTPPKETKKTATGMEDSFDNEAGDTFVVKYWTPSSSYAFTFDDIKKQDMVETDVLKNVSHEDIADGNGFFSLRKESVKGTTGNIYAYSVVKRGTMLIACEASYDEGRPTTPPDACKTLRAM